jgi:hypothetical protein
MHLTLISIESDHVAGGSLLGRKRSFHYVIKTELDKVKVLK